ncbi:OLC1v1028068C1 [Oldenlandia corymbosa var. corymbosa]|uniref:AMP deaminase n=1 Tax=Oldenlandia corymbosa var. corymbosa TaxID=529605 RepID=A0AAV1CDR9_OLDCO|nr:OLC1v1028068C1 [Oldenlandia corymbosa var. corymbosa]
MESSSVELALAALFGASVMAISAFYIHKRSVDQVLDRLIKLRRKPPPKHQQLVVSDADVGAVDCDEAEFYEYEIGWRSENFLKSSGDINVHDGGLDEDGEEDVGFERYRVSSSMPNVRILSNEWADNQDKRGFSNELDRNLDFISSNLPPLRTQQTDGNDRYADNSLQLRVGSVGHIVTPTSSRGYAVESAGDSDEEGTELATNDGTFFPYNKDAAVSIPNLHIATERGNQIQSQQSTAIPYEGKAKADEENGKVDTTTLHYRSTDLIVASNHISGSTRVHESMNVEDEEVMKMIRECLDLREKYVFREKIAPWMKGADHEHVKSDVKQNPLEFVPVEATAHHCRMEDGVVHVYASETDTEDLFPVASSTAFFTDMHHILKVLSVGNVRSTCHHRLRFLEEKFRLHVLVNADREFLAQKSAPHRDLYNIRKVDTHVHHSACMNQKHLLRFIKSKLRKEPDEVVIFRDGQYLTLKEVFESLDLTGYDLNVDLLDVHADKSTFHRFDKFNLKYNPCGQSRLREIFLKQDNLIQGRFLAEVTKEVLSDLEASKYQLAEYRISIYGRKQSEWDQLASWFVNNGIYSDNAVWLIQLPRLYNVYKSMGTVTSFQTILDNVFIPLFEVTVDPRSHPHLHIFLMQVVGFDIVDDESKPERRPTKHMPTPAEWTNDFNPAFSYYAYYCYANLYTLNKLRESKGLPTIRFRPHCGEAGDIDHLAAGFLLCHNISHGINLRKSPVLQYLYYLAQIGLAMSPLSNNSLFLDYHRNPFPMFFQRGLNVSLSTDDPLQIHLTKEPLVEEYSVAAKVWKLSSCDLCEIARNSVYQSGFSHNAKSHWLGSGYYRRGPPANDIHKTNVPNTRISFRHETWEEEMQYVYAGNAKIPREIDH